MRKFNIDQINSNIELRRSAVNYELAKMLADKKRIRRTRKRSEDESKAIIELTKATVARARKEGKFIKLNGRVVYYDPRD